MLYKCTINLFTTYLPYHHHFIWYMRATLLAYISSKTDFGSNLNLKSVSSGNKHVFKYALLKKQCEKREPLKRWLIAFLMKDREAWCAAVHGGVRHGWATEQ